MVCITTNIHFLKNLYGDFKLQDQGARSELEIPEELIAVCSVKTKLEALTLNLVHKSSCAANLEVFMHVCKNLASSLKLEA